VPETFYIEMGRCAGRRGRKKRLTTELAEGPQSLQRREKLEEEKRDRYIRS